MDAAATPQAPQPAVDQTTGRLFEAQVIGAKPVSYPRGAAAGKNDDDNDDDLIIGGENGLHYVQSAGAPPRMPATSGNGRVPQLQLRLKPAGPVLQRGAALVTGQTPTVSVADFDHDGLPDIIAGTSEGRILFAKRAAAPWTDGSGGHNRSASSSSSTTTTTSSGTSSAAGPGAGFGAGFLRPVALRVGDDEGGDAADSSAEILVQGGYRTDIQGPTESRWGYTAPVAVDWNDDGLMDIVSSDNSALTKVYLRYRTRKGTLALRREVALKLDGLELHGTWRNGPAARMVWMDDASGQMRAHASTGKGTGTGMGGGESESVLEKRMALVTSDEQDEAHLYYRIDDYNIADGGKLRYRVPNCTASTRSTCLQNIQTNYLHAGGSGRLKYSLVDFDGDGLVDLLLGTCGYHSVPSNTTGLPACAPKEAGHNGTTACGNNGATVLFMRQSNASQQQSEAQSLGPVFEWPLWVTARGARIAYGGQEAGVAPFDAGDGKISLIVATPGGSHVFWAAADLGTSAAEPPIA